MRILARAVEAKPDAKLSTFASLSDPGAAVTVSMGREGVVFVDPYTGNITGEGSKGLRGFFGTVTDLHRFMALSGDGRPVGKAITGACNLMFLALAITGIYIWFPRKVSWRAMRPRAWFSRKTKGKARDLNWHTTIGFWSSLVLIVLTVTAAVISYQWAGNLVYTLTGNEVPKPQNASLNQGNQTPPFTIPENLDTLWAKAEERVPDWKLISLRLPVGKEASFTIDEGASLNVFGRASLSLDAATAETVKWEPYAEKNSAVQIRSWMRFLHTGESLGIVGQTVAFFACIGGSFLVYTGFALALRRLSSFRRRRSKDTETFEKQTNLGSESPLQTLET